MELFLLEHTEISMRQPNNHASTTQMITTPAANDVLCGKDKTYAQRSAGTALYRTLIRATAAPYAATSTKNGKMQLTAVIVHTMRHQHGSRFLKPSQIVVGAWEELSVSAARDKTSHALRFCAAHHPRTAAATMTRTRACCRRPVARHHRRTVSADTSSSRPMSTRRKFHTVPTPLPMTCVSSWSLEDVVAEPVPSMCDDDLDAIMREPMRWEDVVDDVDDDDEFLSL